MTRNRRSLVLSNEGANHPFRRSLPAHVFTGKTVRSRPAGSWLSLSRNEWRGFFGTYCASFVAVSAFIA